MDLVRRLLPHETTSNRYIFSSLYRRFFSILFIWLCCSRLEFWWLDITWFLGGSLRTSLGLRFVWYTSLRRLLSDIFLGRRLASDMNSLYLLFECCAPCLASNRSSLIFGKVRVSLCSKSNETLLRRRFASTFISKIDQLIAFLCTIQKFIFRKTIFISWVCQTRALRQEISHIFLSDYNSSRSLNFRMVSWSKRYPSNTQVYNWITIVWSAQATCSIYFLTASLAVWFIVSKTHFINTRKLINHKDDVDPG